ncbi:MAG: hypothetical protein INF79_09680 [Roseomonas sp.]|nr:hypothetical protein [Roseomonas sp.]
MSDGTPTEHFVPAREEVASFALLGAGVPFTSARLLGARIRPSPEQRGFELVLINPAQAKGNYILPWRGLPEVGAPTLFDLRLWELLSKASEIYPTAIRREALSVAAEGLAGRAVAKAAQEALREENANEAKLLAEFMAQCSNGPPATLSNAAKRNPTEAEVAQASEVLTARDPALTQSLRSLATTLSFIGPSTVSAPARRLMSEISMMAEEYRAFVNEADGAAENLAIRFLVESADSTLHYTKLALAEIETRLSDIVALLARPRIKAARVLDRARRVEWLLDGWGVLVALWRRTEPEMRRSIVWDLAVLVPALPKEVHHWFAKDQAREAPAKLSRVVSQGADWRSGQSLDITERNEGLISFSLNYENRMTPSGAGAKAASGRVHVPRYRAKMKEKLRRSKNIDGELRLVSKDAGALSESLSAASDENLLRIVAMIDRLPDRSKLDGLLTEVRPRLAILRPPRPVTLTRLLFLPLSGALVDPNAWRRDPATIPRNALHLISSLVGELLGEAAQSMSKALRHAVFSDVSIVEKFGGPFWEGAAKGAERITPGTRWAEAGFSPEDFRTMMRLAAGIWTHAGALWKILRMGEAQISVGALREALTGPASEGPEVFTAAFRTLLRSVRNSSAFVGLATGGMPPGVSEIVIENLENWIDATLPQLTDCELYDAAERAEELGKTMEALALTPFFQIPRRRRQLSALFWRLEEYCRIMMLEVIEEQILPALTPSSEAFSDAAFAQLERDARAARRLELLGRHFGNDPSYDEIQQRLIQAFSAVRKDMSGASITQMDLLRLGEILLGREKARTLLSF